MAVETRKSGLLNSTEGRARNLHRLGPPRPILLGCQENRKVRQIGADVADWARQYGRFENLSEVVVFAVVV